MKAWIKLIFHTKLVEESDKVEAYFYGLQKSRIQITEYPFQWLYEPLYIPEQLFSKAMHFYGLHIMKTDNYVVHAKMYKLWCFQNRKYRKYESHRYLFQELLQDAIAVLDIFCRKLRTKNRTGLHFMNHTMHRKTSTLGDTRNWWFGSN